MPKIIPQEIKERILEEYRSNNLSQKIISQRNNISLQTLQSWLRKEKTNPTFDFISMSNSDLKNIESKSNKPIQDNSQQFTLQFPSGIKLRIPTSVAPSFLIEILRNFK